MKELLKKEVEKIKLTNKEVKELETKTKDFIEKLETRIKNNKIKADVFLGGSFAKKTMMKKDKYDIDIFVRFSDKYKDKEISDLLAKCLTNARRVHGSRDYFAVSSANLTFEIVPTIKIKKAKEARNVTDLSYFHVSYIKNKIKKSKKLADEILLAKAFCYAQKFYGAESYIRGFSGYALELLVSHYKSFLGFLKAVNRTSKQIVLDPEKFYKNGQDVLTSLNEAKLTSPIIFVDPTFKERNALAALSSETFERFKKIAKSFINNPSASYFKEKEINSSSHNFILRAETNRQEGDIAGSKLLKFYNFLARELDKYYMILKKDFSYDNSKGASFFFNIVKKKERIIQGPPVDNINAEKFKNSHRAVFVKNKRLFSREKVDENTKDKIIVSEKIRKVMSDMGITSLNKI